MKMIIMFGVGPDTLDCGVIEPDGPNLPAGPESVNQGLCGGTVVSRLPPIGRTAGAIGSKRANIDVRPIFMAFMGVEPPALGEADIAYAERNAIPLPGNILGEPDGIGNAILSCASRGRPVAIISPACRILGTLNEAAGVGLLRRGRG